MGWWNDIFVKRAEDWVYIPMSTKQAPPDGERKPVQPNTAYLSIFLQSMRVVDVRRGLNKFFGTVHSYISLPHLSGAPARFNVITTPGNLRGVDATRIDQVIQIGQRLLGPTPYRGGDLELETGLFSIQSVDLADSFLSFLERASGLAGVAYVSNALPFAELIKDGVNLLVGSTDASILEIGLSRKFTALETGYYIVMRAPKADIDPTRLHLDPNDYRLLDHLGQPVGSYPYMVLKISASPSREDWFQIPELSAAYAILQADLRRGDSKSVEESLTMFRRIALTSNDLLEADSDQLVAQVTKRVREVMAPATRGGPKRPGDLPDLADIPLYSSG